MSGNSKNISPQGLELYIGGFGSFPPAISESSSSPAKHPAAPRVENNHPDRFASPEPSGDIEGSVMALARSLAMLSLQSPAAIAVGARGFRPFR